MCGVGGGDAREQLGQGRLDAGQPLHQAGRRGAFRRAQLGRGDAAGPRAGRAAARARGRAARPGRSRWRAGLVQRLASVEPALAQLFASIAASDATHVTVLTDNGLAEG